MDMDNISSANGEYYSTQQHPKHIPFHRRGGEKYALHVGHRPPKRQQRRKKKQRQQQSLTKGGLPDLLEEELRDIAQNSNQDNLDNLQNDMANNNNIINSVVEPEEPKVIVPPTQPEESVPQNHILPDPVQPLPTEAPKSLLADILTPDTPPPRDPFSCEGMMARIQQDGIQLVAFDFDKSILDIHTQGKWDQSAADLVPHVRPDMKCLIRNCRERGIHVAVATFSTQKDLIQEVLQEALGYSHAPSLAEGGGPGGEEGSDATTNTNNNHPFTGPYIPVYGREDKVDDHTRGKQSQLILAMEGFNRQNNASNNNNNNNNHPVEAIQQKEGETEGAETPSTPPPMITPASTLLVDDDRTNVKIAQDDGYQTILFRPDDRTEAPVPVEAP